MTSRRHASCACLSFAYVGEVLNFACLRGSDHLLLDSQLRQVQKQFKSGPRARSMLADAVRAKNKRESEGDQGGNSAKSRRTAELTAEGKAKATAKPAAKNKAKAKAKSKNK